MFLLKTEEGAPAPVRALCIVGGEAEKVGRVPLLEIGEVRTIPFEQGHRTPSSVALCGWLFESTMTLPGP